MATSEKARRLLISLLAALEAPWRPLRRREWKLPNVGQWIFHCRHEGLKLWGEAGHAARRVERSRLTAELRRAGFLSDSGLTVSGKRQARGWSHPFRLDTIREAISRLRAAREAGHYLYADLLEEYALIPEFRISGSRGDHQSACRQAGRLQGMVIPLLADGLLVARTDGLGHGFYGVPAEHESDLDAIVTDLYDKNEFDPALADYYTDQYGHYVDVMIAQAEHTNTIYEFMVAAGVPLKSGLSRADPGDVAPLFPWAEDDD